MKNNLTAFSKKLNGDAASLVYDKYYSRLVAALSQTGLPDSTIMAFIVALSKYAPLLDGYSNLIELIWGDGGVIEDATNIKGEAETALKNSQQEYKNKVELVRKSLDQLKKHFNNLKSEELYKIKEATYLTSTLVAGSGQKISDRFENTENEIDGVEKELAVAERLYYEAKSGYIKNATKKLDSLLEKIDELDDAIDGLEKDSKDVVEAKRSEVANLLAEFEALTKGKLLTKEVKELYDSASYEIKQGDSGGSLGACFFHYSNAEKKLKAAKSLFLEKPAELVVSIKAEIERLEKLVAGAEKDNIEVSTEKTLLRLISENPDVWVGSETAANLNRIEQNIIKKAELKWGFLERKRYELLQKIELGGRELSDLKSSIEIAEDGAFDNRGKIKWSEALGRLKAIHEAYTEIENQITQKELALLTGNGLVVNKAVFIGEVELEKPVEISVDIFIKNPYPYNASNVAVKVANDIRLLESNIIKGREFLSAIAQTDSILTLYMKQIDPYANYEILFKKNETIVHIISNKTEIYAGPDGSAIGKEEITFLLDYDVSSFSPMMNEGDNVEIDGLSFSRTLKKGTHKLTRSYVIKEAYRSECANYNAKKDFLRTNIQYDINILPLFDIKELTFFVEKPLDAKSFSVNSLGLEKITEKTDIGNGLYSFKVLNLKKGKATTLRVTYFVDNATDYLNKQLSLFDVTNLSETARTIYDQVVAAIAANNITEALAKIEQLKGIIEKEKKEREKISSEYARLFGTFEDEKKKIDEALSALKIADINSSIVGLLEARSALLNKTLTAAAAKDSAEGVKLLEAVDKTWLKNELATIKKEIFNEYNSYKKAYLNLTDTLSSEFADFESTYAKFEASNDVEDLPALLIAQKKVKDAVNAAKLNESAIHASIHDSFKLLRANITALLNKYVAEKKIASGTQFAALFSIDEKEVQRHLKEIEKALEGGRSLKELNDLISKSQEDVVALSNFFSSLEDEANEMTKVAEEAYNRQTGLSDADRKTAAQYIANAKNALADKKYVDALKASEKALALLKTSTQKEDVSLLLLGLTALFIIGAISIYIIKYRKDGGSEKPYRRLARIK
jgi:hypothetical protein